MYPILEKRLLAEGIWLMQVLAPRVAHSAQPGQFVIVRVDEHGERIPLTISDFDPAQGSVTIVTQAIGASTRKICSLDAGDALVAEAGAQLHSGDASGGQLLRGSLRLSVGLAAHHVQMDARGGYHGAGGLIGIADKKEKCGLQCHCYVDLPENQESERTDKRCRFPCGSLICTPVIWYVTVW